MSGFLNTIVQGRSSVEYFNLLRSSAVVSGIATPSPALSNPLLRSILGIEPRAIGLTNPSGVDANVEVYVVTEEGEFLAAATTVTPLASTPIAITPGIVRGEHVRVDLLPSSLPGAQVDVVSTWSDIDTVRRTKTPMLAPEFVDLVVGKPGNVQVISLFAFLTNPGPGFQAEFRVVEEDGDSFFFRNVLVAAGISTFFTFGPVIREGQRLQGRANTGSGYFLAYIIDQTDKF